MKLSSQKPDSLGDLSEEELAVLLSLLKPQKVISRIALGNAAGWQQVYKSFKIAGQPPGWLTAWAKQLEVAPLFSIGEGDCIEGVAYILSDLSTNEHWLGVAGGLCEVVESPNLIQIPCSGRRVTSSDVYPVWTHLLTYEHEDLMSDVFGGDFKVYDRKLLPAKDLRKFKEEVAVISKTASGS